MNAEEYVHTMTWLQALTGLLEQMQVRPSGCISNTFPDYSVCFSMKTRLIGNQKGNAYSTKKLLVTLAKRKVKTGN